MSSALSPPLRRLVLVLVLVGAGAVAFRRIRHQRTSVVPVTPQWPPFEPRVVPPPVDRPEAPVPATATAEATDAAGSAAAPWVMAGVDGTAPEGHPVKVKVSSGIFHVPGGRFYERTTADRWYASAAAAEADGYRPSKS